MDTTSIIKKRKEDGIRLALLDVGMRKKTTLFEDIEFIHNALPEINYDEISLNTKFLNHDFNAPIIIGAMTGGSEKSKIVNENLAKAAEELGLGMVVGSQRAALVSKELEETYSITRKVAPHIYIGANIGAAQLEKISKADLERLISMLEANALYIHLNPMQELIQPEGEPNYKNVIANIEKIRSLVDIPIIVKEVGMGISKDVGLALEKTGINAIEIAGAGGTSWIGIEGIRAKEFWNEEKEKLAIEYWDWGIPTAASLYVLARSVKIPLIASGGLYKGSDMAKALAIGASMVALARPLLKDALESSDKVKKHLSLIISSIKASMFGVGARNLDELRKKKLVLKREIKDWIEAMS